MMTTQVGAEHVLKQEILAKHPDFRFSYSRPGFLTWKVADTVNIPAINSIFMRYCGLFLGKIQGTDRNTNATEFWNLVGNQKFDRFHVFSKDERSPGESGYEPGLTPESQGIHESIFHHAPPSIRKKQVHRFPQLAAKQGDIVIDCLLVSPNEWWIGIHQVHDWRSSLPGGLLGLQLPSDAVSRAFLKFEEGIQWSGFPIQTGSRCLDIGSAPGGGSQALLAHGADVIGVDPAEMSPVILSHPNFTHLRGRINQLKRRHFRKTRWIITDINVSPNYTLDVLEELTTHPEIQIRGLLFTLKLLNWNLVADILNYINRVKSWEFTEVKVNQLQFNRQEVTVAAIKRPFRH